MVPEPKLSKYIDDLMQADILAWRDVLFTWLLRSTLAVTSGLVLEGPELFHDIVSLIRQWWFRRKFHFSLPEEHAPEWAKVLAFIGWILITVGVAGEWYTEVHIEDADLTVQSFMDSRFEDAEHKSASLNLRSSVNELEATQLGREEAQLRKDAAHEQLLRIQLEWKVAWRRLSDADKSWLGVRMRPFRTNVALSFGSFDPETRNFATDIALGLQAAQWNVSGPSMVMALQVPRFGNPIQPVETGVFVSSTSDAFSVNAGRVLCDELNNRLGFDVWCERLGKETSADPRTQEVFVAVEGRPEGPQGEAKLRQGAEKAKTKKTSR